MIIVDIAVHGKGYTAEMKLVVYTLLNSYTLTDKIKEVIETFILLKHMQFNTKEIPSRSTIERMQLELGVISDLQVYVFSYSVNDI